MGIVIFVVIMWLFREGDGWGTFAVATAISALYEMNAIKHRLDILQFWENKHG